MQLARDYFFVRIWAAPATIGLYAFKGWFIGMQNPRSPMVVAMVVCAVNFICGVWFVFGLDMGVTGIALSTVVAQYCGLLTAIGFWLRFYRKLAKYFNIRESLQLSSLKLYFSVNGNIFLRTLCLVAVFTFFTSASSGMGNDLLAVNTLLMQLFTLYSYIMDGFAYAGESLIGRFVGNNNLPMIKKCIKYLMLWGVAMGIMFTLLYGVAWRSTLAIFTDNPNIINLAGDFLWWILAVPLVSFTAFIYDGILTGATRTRVMRDAIIIASAMFFLLYYTLKASLGNDALWIAFLTFLLLRGAVQAAMVRGYRLIRS
jgi:MATE family multidrug resistance protein